MPAKKVRSKPFLLIPTAWVICAMAHGQNVDPRNPNPPPVQPPFNYFKENESGLKLYDFLRLVDRYYPKLTGVRLERQIADAKSQEKRGAFDPVFSTETSFLRYNSTSSPGKDSITRMTETVVEIMDRSGVKLAAGQRLNTGNVKSPSSSTGYLGEYFVSAKIPLMRDFRVNAKSVGEQQAQFGQPLADQLVREFRFGLLDKSAQVYWEWVGAGVKLDVAKQLLKLAEDRYKFIVQRYEARLVPRIDTDEAEAEVFRRKGSLEKAERDLQKAELKLNLFLWQQDGNPSGIPDRKLLPGFQTNPESVTPEQEREAKAQALKIRPEFAAIDLSRRIIKLDIALARNDRRAALDLIIGPGYDLGDVGIGLTYKAGVVYSIPLVQNTADGRIRQAETKLQKLDLEQQQLQVEVQTEIDDAISAVRQNYRRVLAAEQELIAARKLEQGETDRFALGIGTLFLINQRERGRAETESRLIDTRVELEQSLVTFRAVTAQLNP